MSFKFKQKSLTSAKYSLQTLFACPIFPEDVISLQLPPESPIVLFLPREHLEEGLVHEPDE